MTYLPLQWMTKAGEGESVRAAIDLKNKVHNTLAKYKRLHIAFRKPSPELPVVEDAEPAPVQVLPSVVTESQWKFETHIPESVSVSDLELDPTTPQAQLAVLKKKYDLCTTPPMPVSISMCRMLPTAHAQFSGVEGRGSCSERPELKVQAPVVPFGMDLYHWGSSSTDIEARTLAP